jgi:hypothetical protein
MSPRGTAVKSSGLLTHPLPVIYLYLGPTQTLEIGNKNIKIKGGEVLTCLTIDCTALLYTTMSCNATSRGVG